MKRISVLFLIVGLALAGCKQNTEQTLKVFNWGVYVDEDLIEEFEAEYGVTVIYDTFDSNESMYTKLMSGEVYDILYPSDYMVERLIQEKALQPLDKAVLTNLGSLMPSVLNQSFDPDNTYSAPYFWGNVGLLYDVEKVDEADLAKGWEILRDPQYKGQIYFYDSERDAFMIALKALGYSANTKDSAQLEKAYEWLKELNQTMDAVYVTDDVIDNMIAGNKAIAVVYSGDAAYILQENPSMRYFAPEEGTNIWVDSMVIPENAQNPKLANAWINFMLSADAAERNTVEVGYTTVRQDVYDAMLEGDYADNNAYAVRTDNVRDEVFVYDEDMKKIISDLWFKVKAE